MRACGELTHQRRPFCDRIPYCPTTYLTDWKTFDVITIQSIIINHIRILCYPRYIVVHLLWRKEPICFRLQSASLGRIMIISQQILDKMKSFVSILCFINNSRQIFTYKLIHVTSWLICSRPQYHWSTMVVHHVIYIWLTCFRRLWAGGTGYYFDFHTLRNSSGVRG